MSVVASTLTSVCVFLPAVFSASLIRNLMGPMSLCLSLIHIFQLSGRILARQAGLPVVYAQRLALICPHGLPLPPRMGAPGAVETEEQEINPPVKMRLERSAERDKREIKIIFP